MHLGVGINKAIGDTCCCLVPTCGVKITRWFV